MKERLKDIIMEDLEKCLAEREEQGKVPRAVDSVQYINGFVRQVKDAINELFVDGRISVERTFNGKNLYINNEKR